MSFLNGLLAFGAAAATLPLVIHLLNRSRFRTLPWGAMQLLETAVRVNHRRIQLEQWLLLLVRCAIPALLALCLARPVLTAWRSLPGGSPVSLVVLLDDSYSMDAVQRRGSRFDRAKQEAAEVIESLPPGSDVSVITMGGKPASLLGGPVFDAEAMGEQVRRLRGGCGVSRVRESLDLALDTLSQMTHGQRQLLVISDFQQTSWGQFGQTRIDKLRERLANDRVPVAMSWLSVSGPPPANVFISDMSVPPTPLAVGQKTTVRVKLRNDMDTSLDAARVVFRVDGRQAGQVEVAVPPRAESDAIFPCQFDSAGSHVVEAELLRQDSLPTDNRREVGIRVLAHWKVLLVNGEPDSQPLKSETDYLAIALSPFAFGRVQAQDLFATETVAPNELSEERLEDVRAVVLANVPRLEPAHVDLLAQYVTGGGCLIVFPGDRIDTAWYQTNLVNRSPQLVPCAYVAASANRPSMSHMLAQHFDHPALQMFNDRRNGNLADAEVRRWFRMVMPDLAGAARTAPRTTDTGDAPVTATDGESIESELNSAARDAHPSVVARLDTGDPLIVEWRCGEGRVMQWATACDDEWSDLPLRPFYVPLMQQVVTSLVTSAQPPLNITTGETAVALFDAAVRDESVIWTTPTGHRQTVRVAAYGSRSMARFSDTRRPGTYRASAASKPAVQIVASVPSAESDLQCVEEERLQALAKHVGADVVASAQEYIEQQRTRRYGREIWRYLWAAVLLLMLIEVVLQQRFARVRT